MKILHISDTHSTIDWIAKCAESVADVILITGDILPNLPRPIVSENEQIYQNQFLDGIYDCCVSAFAGRPVIVVHGNHDFLGIPDFFKSRGNSNVLSCENKIVEIGSERFGGFREIPYLNGEWVGETHDFRGIVDSTFEMNPTILVTHAPASGILDDSGYGIKPLTSALQFRYHSIKAHFFGHCHHNGGLNVEVMGIKFFNGACHAIEHEI